MISCTIPGSRSKQLKLRRMPNLPQRVPSASAENLERGWGDEINSDTTWTSARGAPSGDVQDTK